MLAQHNTDIPREGLVNVALAALQDNFPTTRIDTDEVELLVQALELLWGDDPNVAFARATLHFVRQNWRDAADIYRALAERSARLPHSRAMLAYALHRLRDPDWRSQAEQLRDSTVPGVALLIESLIGEDELEAAVETSRRTGTLAVPESVERAAQWAKQASREPARESAAAPAADTGVSSWLRYGLRA